LIFNKGKKIALNLSPILFSARAIKASPEDTRSRNIFEKLDYSTHKLIIGL